MKNNKLLNILLVGITIFPLTVNAEVKKETVFNNLNTEGKIINSTVTNYICSIDKETYEDNSRLEKIISLNGNETFTKDNDNITWKVKGSEVYYQGTPNEESPIDINIKYYLNDKEISAKKIKGKKGNVKIKISLTNKTRNTVNINGYLEELPTPFVLMAGTIIDTDNNSNIHVTNGRVVNNGGKSILASIASPGLYESLNIDELSNLNEIEFSFDTTNFKMNNIYIIATPKVLEEKDIKLFKDLDNISDSIRLLQDSMNKIEEGSTKLKEGSENLLTGSELIDSKLPKEESNVENETKLNYLNTQNTNAINSLTSANENLNTKLGEINTKITETTRAKELLVPKYTDALNAYSPYEELHNSLLQIPENANDEKIAYLTNNTITTREELNNKLQTFNLLKNQKDALEAAVSSIDGTLTLLNSTKESILTSIEANNNLITLLSANNTVVNSSLNTINSMRSLTVAMNKLNDGVKALSEGATTLNTGINTFNEQGIKKLTEYSYKINNYSSKLEALINLSKNYKGYASNNSSETIFVNKVQSIK